MKKLLLVSLMALTGCTATKNDFIVGHWSEVNKDCTDRAFCSFTVEPSSGLTSAYSIKFDVVPPDYPNNAIIHPNYKGTPGLYLYTDAGTDKGIMMYLDKDILIETYHGTRFKKNL